MITLTKDEAIHLRYALGICAHYMRCNGHPTDDPISKFIEHEGGYPKGNACSKEDVQPCILTVDEANAFVLKWLKKLDTEIRGL